MTTRRDLLRLAAAMPLAGAELLPLVAGQAASFEVVSVKLTQPDEVSSRLVTRSRVELHGWRVMTLIELAYQVKQQYQVDERSWSNTFVNRDLFTILAKIPENSAPNSVPEMLRTLLAERFALVTHREKKMMPAYVLTVAKGGPAFQAAPLDSELSETEILKAAVFREKFNIIPLRGGWRHEQDRATMGMLASDLSEVVERPVIDLTDLHGRYKIRLDLMSETSDGDGPALTGSGLAVAYGLKALGLKLEERKMPCDVLIIDRVERPTEN